MDQMSINIIRGKMQFENKINQVVKYPEVLEFLHRYWINHVGVMEAKEQLSEDIIAKGYAPRIEYFASGRMAKVCIELSNEISNCDSELYSISICRYLDMEVPHVNLETNDTNNEKLNISLMEEIILANDEDIKKIGDINNLISDVEKNDLSIEGKRAVGYLPKDFDTLDPRQSDELEVDRIPLAILSNDTNNNLILICPNCYSDSLYDQGYSRYICMDCDTEFRSSFGLGDLLPDHNDEWSMMKEEGEN